MVIKCKYCGKVISDKDEFDVDTTLKLYDHLTKEHKKEVEHEESVILANPYMYAIIEKGKGGE